MVQNHQVLIVLGFVVECTVDVDSPVRKQIISSNAGLYDNVDGSDPKPASFVRKQTMSANIGADDNAEFLVAGEANPVRKHMVSGKVAADGKIDVSDAVPASVVRKQTASERIGADGNIDVIDAREANPFRKRIISGKIYADGKIDVTDAIPASFVRKHMMTGKIAADGNIEMSDLGEPNPVRKRITSAKDVADGKIDGSDAIPASFIRKQIISEKIGGDGNIEMSDTAEASSVRKRINSGKVAIDGKIDIYEGEAARIVRKQSIQTVANTRKNRKQDETTLNVQRTMEVEMKSMIFYRAITPWTYMSIMFFAAACIVLLAIIALQCTVNAEMADVIFGHLESIRTLVEERAASSQTGVKPFKDELKDMFPMLNLGIHVRECRQIIKLRILEIFEELVAEGLVDKNNYHICADENSKNVFAKFGAGSMRQSTMDAEQAALGKYQERYVVCANRRMDDVMWNTKDPEFIPRASMSAKHRFLTMKDLHWQWFNPIVYGLVPKSHGGVDIADALLMIEDIEAAATHYVSNSSGWSEDVQLFFNPYPHNGFSALVVHILDMNQLGMSFEYHKHKTCPLNFVKEALQQQISDEIREEFSGFAPSSEVTKWKRQAREFRSMPSDGFPDTESEEETST